MRLVRALPILAALPLAAQAWSPGGPRAVPATGWVIGVHQLQPTLSVRAEGVRDGRATRVDSEADLGLGRSGRATGFLVEYQGQTQAFQVSYGSPRFGGDRVLTRDILLDGTPYAAGTGVKSSAKVVALEGVWTWKAARSAEAWIGLDLGALALRADLSAHGSLPVQERRARPGLLIPQVGLTGWSSGADGLLESRLYLRYMAGRGAHATRYGLDARAYLYPSFGLRAFFEATRLRVPQGAFLQDLDLQVETRSTGVGLVVRF